MSTAQAAYDPDADALYVRLVPNDVPHGYTDSQHWAEGIIIDRAADGSIIGVEVLDVTKRSRLEDKP